MCCLPDVFNEWSPKARQPHKCCECRGIIARGEKYQKIQGLWDGRWRTFKTCIDCKELREKITSSIKDQEDWPPFNDLYVTVFEARDQPTDNVMSFMDTRRKRNAPESPNGWMERLEAKLRPAWEESQK